MRLTADDAGALLRPAGGDADRPGHRGGLRLFVVSRFREDTAEGTTPLTAVRRFDDDLQPQ